MTTLILNSRLSFIISSIATCVNENGERVPNQEDKFGDWVNHLQQESRYKMLNSGAIVRSKQVAYSDVRPCRLENFNNVRAFPSHSGQGSLMTFAKTRQPRADQLLPEVDTVSVNDEGLDIFLIEEQCGNGPR